MGRWKSCGVAGLAVALLAAGCDRTPKQASGTSGTGGGTSGTTDSAANGQRPTANGASPDSNRQSSIVNRPSAEPGSTRLGVYTETQAAKGYDVYLGSCNSCHAGLGNHSGQFFRDRWGDRSLAEMFDYMMEYMPKDAPGSLSPEDNVRVMAYLLKVNGMPAGEVALPTDYAALQQLWFDTTSAKK